MFPQHKQRFKAMMTIRSASLLALTSLLTAACFASGNSPTKRLDRSAFQGFTIVEQGQQLRTQLSGYEFQLKGGQSIEPESCEEADHIDPEALADYDYFRFRLLQTSCIAVALYSRAETAQSGSIPHVVDEQFVKRFPASATRILSEADLQQKEGHTIGSLYADANFSSDNKNTIRVITDDDEYYFTTLARADFNLDGVEDLLIRAEWYARNAHGKHVDLVILSQQTHQGPLKIEWRFSGH